MFKTLNMKTSGSEGWELNELSPFERISRPGCVGETEVKTSRSLELETSWGTEEMKTITRVPKEETVVTQTGCTFTVRAWCREAERLRGDFRGPSASEKTEDLGKVQAPQEDVACWQSIPFCRVGRSHSVNVGIFWTIHRHMHGTYPNLL